MSDLELVFQLLDTAFCSVENDKKKNPPKNKHQMNLASRALVTQKTLLGLVPPFFRLAFPRVCLTTCTEGRPSSLGFLERGCEGQT